MEWKKEGLIFSVDKHSDWMYSHAAVPFAEHLKEDIFRIYFTTRDKQNRSHGAFIDVDITNPKNILNISLDPIISPGPLGSFDDSGTMPTYIVYHQDKKYIYYIGWNLGVTVPFRNAIGLAISKQTPHTAFKKISNGPIIDRSIYDPCFVASLCILREDDKWRMWYLSCEKWEMDPEGSLKHYYNIKYAVSFDGINWQREGIICIPFKNSEEYAISRPCVLKEDDMYKMWFSYRGGEETYRIGYAESKDGIQWRRLDHLAGIDVSQNGWDSEMIEYPFVFSHKGGTYMLYNGNGYGRSGFGYAILHKG